MSRPPFHSVGVLPFVLGSVLAWNMFGTFSWPIFGWSTLAVVLIMLATYYSGEYYDLKEDKLSGQMERNTFTGGSQIIAKEVLPRNYARIAACVSLGLAGIVGLVLQFYYHTGNWTIALGTAGMIGGFFYSTPPLRWVKRGIGELIIGFCYGWLPVATAFYLQTGSIDGIINWISIPIACTIFNVIFINEFPDHPADLIAGKTNLTVRMGKSAGAYLYIAMNVLAWIAFAWSVSRGLSAASFLFYLPVFLISLGSVLLVLRKDYLIPKRLELICGLTIVVNLGTALAYLLAIWLGS
jgi:1,4-dihydroxy-2-naphthoate polyprenyltransferase